MVEMLTEGFHMVEMLQDVFLCYIWCHIMMGSEAVSVLIGFQLSIKYISVQNYEQKKTVIEFRPLQTIKFLMKTM